MCKIVKVLDWDGNFICNAFIRGIEYVNGKEGWFTSITLLSLTGENMYEEGDIVRVTNVCKDFTLSDEEYEELSTRIGSTGVIVDVDYSQIMTIYQVLLDVYEDGKVLEADEPKIFLEEEVELIEKGGEVEDMSAFEATPKYIMEQSYLSLHDKLVYVAIYEEDPCDIDLLLKRITIPYEDMLLTLEKLLGFGFIVESTKERHVYYPTFKMGKPQHSIKKKEKETETTTVTGAEANLLLLMAVVENYYKERGVSHKISKKGRKNLKKVVRFLNNTWKKKDEFDSLGEFEVKADLYTSYVEYVFQNLDDEDLNQIKRLVYSGNKQAWRKSLHSPHTGKFIPYFYNYQWSGTHFYNIPKQEIPKEPKDSSYWTTVNTFLLSRWRTNSYPVCRQVLFALETIIIYSMFRKLPVSELVLKHKKYVKLYRQAVKAEREDDLEDFFLKDKKNEDKENRGCCYDCTKKNTCSTYSPNIYMVNCNDKIKK